MRIFVLSLWLIGVFAVFASGLPAQVSGYAFNPFAGRPFFGSTDGPRNAASFATPVDVATDKNGNVYVVDALNQIIRKITPAGIVSTFAGLAGATGSADGAGSAARFNTPSGVATDEASNLYVADTGNHTIRKITPAGVVSTLAGQAGRAGSADGNGPAARFNSPMDVTVYPDGTAYVADTKNHLIREITPAGHVTTYAGQAGISGNSDGPRDTSLFTSPTNVVVFRGNIYVTGLESQAIRWISPTGLVVTLAGESNLPGTDDGTIRAARFNRPAGMAVDGNGNVYIADSFNHAIRRMAPVGVVTTMAGQKGTSGDANGMGNDARFSQPMGVAVDDNGNVFVADLINNMIRQITPAGAVTTFAGGIGVSVGAEDGTGSAARFNSPQGVAVDLAGNAFVADAFNRVIRKITPDGVVTTFAGAVGQIGSADGTGSAARFSDPRGVAVDRAGNVYVSDAVDFTVRKITSLGVVTTLAGSARQSGDADGQGSAARFLVPNGLAVAPDGTVYMADQENGTIRKITSTGLVSTLAGLAGQRAEPPVVADGQGRSARFVRPTGVVLDSAGNLFVSDSSSATIRKVTPEGVVTTIAGQDLVHGTADGIGRAAQFNSPIGIAIDRRGTLYVADGNNTIRQVTPAGVVTTLVAKSGAFDRYEARQGDHSIYFTTNVATDIAGNLYVVDGGNNAIRKAVSTTRLVNLAVRSRAGTGDQTLIMGFGLAGTAAEHVLLRGVGPGLIPMGILDVVTDPQLKLLDNAGRSIQENDDWGGSPRLSQLFASVGAYPIDETSKDAALDPTLPAQSYTAQVAAKNATGGVALMEVYDADAGTAGRLVNASVRTTTGGGVNSLITGFVVSGTAPKTVLIRVAGPSLAKFGIAGFSLLQDPKLTLYNGSTTIAENDNWGGTAELKAVSQSVGAFDLDADTSKDAALLATLDPGAYTVVVAGASATNGVALVEIYVVR